MSGEQEVLERIERARKRPPRVREERITMAHGAGGRATRTLVEAIFAAAFGNSLEDQAVFRIEAGRMAVTTDSFVVSPLFFPGGDIGALAVHGTVNDLAVGGARPLYLTAGFILEEGFPVSDLRRIVESMAAASSACGVSIVAGDTKVVPRGKADGCFINTAGVGVVRTGMRLGAPAVVPGDAVLVSGPVGDHGVAIMVARAEMDIECDVASDSGPLWATASALMDALPPGALRCMRDATRGGVATVLNEVALDAGVGMVVREAAVPVRDGVRGACELLGLDPLYVACEGRLVAFVDGSWAGAAAEACPGAALIGTVRSEPAGLVLLETAFGGTRILDMLVGDPLPRIC